jgi:hypothetical protein
MRNLEYLNAHRIIYSKNPVKDVPTEVFEWGNYYEHGTYECYDLFKSKAKINTFKSLRWHLHVLWHLNPHISYHLFFSIAQYICNVNNGFVTFKIKPGVLSDIALEIFNSDLEKPPPNRLRKIVFNHNCKLTTPEKLSIVGTLMGKTKKISEQAIYETMLYIHDLNEKITIKKLAQYLMCTTRTVHRNMSDQLQAEKIILNKEL